MAKLICSMLTLLDAYTEDERGAFGSPVPAESWSLETGGGHGSLWQTATLILEQNQ